jgi:hypothetical protein
MTPQASSSAQAEPGAGGEAAAYPASVPSPPGSSPVQAAAAATEQRPEIAVGAAFAAGFMAAKILRRLAR